MAAGVLAVLLGLSPTAAEGQTLPEVTVTPKALSVIGGSGTGRTGGQDAVFVLSRTGPITADLVVEFTMAGASQAYTGTLPDRATIPMDSMTHEVPIRTRGQEEGDNYSITLTVDAVTGRYSVGDPSSASINVGAFINDGLITGMPRITGILEVGRTLTIDTTDLDDEDGLDMGVFNYRWRRADDAAGTNARDIPGETGATYTLVDTDLGDHFQAEVSARDNNGNWNAVVRSDFTGEVMAATARGTPATGMPAITGPVVVGQTLTATPGDIADDDGLTSVSYSYRWQSRPQGSSATAWTDISGATGPTYQLSANELNDRVRVVASFMDDDSNPEERPSAETQLVDAMGAPVVSIRAENPSVVGNGSNDVVFILEWTGTIPSGSFFLFDLTDPNEGVNGLNLEGVNNSVSVTSSPQRLELQTRMRSPGDTDRVVTFTLKDGAGYAIANPFSVTVSASVTAPAGATPVVTVTAKATSVGSAPGRRENAVFIIARTGPTTAALTVNIAVSGEGAPNSVINANTMATIPAGSEDVELELQPTALGPGDSDLMMTLQIRPGGGRYTVGDPATATVTITENVDTRPFVSIAPPSPATVAEGEDAVFTMTLSGPAHTVPFSFRWSLATSGTFPSNAPAATAADILDGATTRGTVSFAVGDTMKTVTIRVRTDDVDEGDETLRIVLASASDPINVARPQEGNLSADVTITNVAPPAPPAPGVPEVTVGVGAATVVGDGSNEVEFTFTWTGSIPGREPFTIDLLDPDDGIDGGAFEDTGAQIGTGGATGPHNFRLPTRMLPPGADDRVVTLTLYPAQPFYTVAGTGTVMVTVTAPPAAGAAPVVTVAAKKTPVLGGSGRGGEDAVFVLTRTGGDMAADLVVDFTMGGDQGAYNNYGRRPTMETIPAGASMVDVSVPTPEEEAGVRNSMTLTIDDPGDGRYTVGGTPGNMATVVVTGPATNAEPTGNPSVTGMARVGVTLTAGIGTIMDADDQPTEADLAWQWQRETSTDTWEDIAGERSNTYTLADADEGLRVRVRARFDDEVSNLTEAVFSLPTAAVAAATVQNTVGVRAEADTVVGDGTNEIVFIFDVTGGEAVEIDFNISGRDAFIGDASTQANVANGGTLRRTTTSLTPGSASIDVTFTINSVDTAGYTIATGMGSATVTVTAPGSAPAPTGTPAMGTPTISGTVRAGQTVTAVTTGISDADGPAMPAFSYQWRRADDDAGASEADIAGATSATYMLSAADTGKYLQVVVSFTDGGGTPERVASAWTEVENSPAVGRPTISGTFVIGEDVTAVTTNVRDADGPAAPAFSYQWRRADDSGGAGEADLGSETSASYTLVAADEDKYLQVVVSFTDGGGTLERVASAWTPVSDRPATGEPRVTGTVEVGRVLTVHTTGITDVDGELGFVYQWARDTDTPNVWEDAGPQTQANTYLVAEADQGRRLRVLVIATDALGGVTRLTSVPTAVVAAEGSTPDDPAATEARVREATDQTLALLAPNVAANTVQVLTTRFESIAAGGPGGGAPAAAKLGGRPLGAFAGASRADGAGGSAAVAAEFTREVAGLFGLHLPAAGSGAAAGSGTAAGARADAGAGVSAADAGLATNEPGAALNAPGVFTAPNAAAQLGRGRGANEVGEPGAWRDVGTDGLHAPELRRLLAQSSFSVQLGAAHGAHGGASGGGHWTVWGRGAASGFEGTEKDSALDVDGESVSAYLGADVQRGDLALGLAVGHSEGELDYAGAAGAAGGELETELTGVHPYLHWTQNRDTSLYAMLGYGFGEATLKDASLDASLTSDLDMRMLAAGLYHALSGSETGRRYEVKLDAFWVNLESDGARAAGQNGVDWAAVDAQSGRVRLALTGAAPLAQGGGGAGSLLAEGELAARMDAGDAQGAKLGAELGAGLRWAQGGFSLSARGRVLLVLSDGDFDDYEEWGASLSASYRATGTAGRGLRFTLAPAWGETQSGVDALYESAEALRGLGDAGGRRSSRSIGGLPDRLDFELGYGLAALGGRAELLPFGRFSLAGAGDAQKKLRLGARFDLPHVAGDALAVHRLGFELFGEQRMGAEREQRVGLELVLGF